MKQGERKINYKQQETKLNIMKMVDEFDKHGCAFMNEAEREEVIDEIGLDYWEVEIKHFEEEVYGE